MDIEFLWDEEYPSSSVTKHTCTVDGEIIAQIYVKRQEASQQTFVTVLYKGYGERRSTVILTPDTVYSAVYANMRSIEDDYRKRKGAFDESVDAEWWR